MPTQLADGGSLPVICAKHRSDVEQVRTGPTFSIDDRTLRTCAYAKAQRIGNTEATLQEAAPQRIFRALNVVVGSRAVEHAVEHFRLALSAAPSAPVHFDSLASRNHALQIASIDSQPP